MLTRLEVNGFKNLFDVGIDFGPYTCIAGPNAVGKSNLFDVIEFMSLLADHPFMEAAQLLRSAGDRPGDPRTLFWYDGSSAPKNMSLVAEMIVPRTVHDDFGQEARPTSTFLRYEIELAYSPPRTSAILPLGGIRLVKEDLNYITKSEAREKLAWVKTVSFRDTLVINRRKSTGYISTNEDGGSVTFQVHQDGGSRGQPKRSSAAPRSVLSTVNTADDPTVLAARREMQQWRKLALEPTAMRTPDPIMSSSAIGSNGAHLAAALFRLSQNGEPDVYDRVAATAAALTDVRNVQVDYEPKRDILTLEAQLGTGPFLPARSLSDGTLRFLALAIIEADDEYGGLICMEEPENGIHPAKISAMVELLQDLAVDPSLPPGPDNPLRQVIVNTHSPRFVAQQKRENLVLAVPASINVDGQEVRSLQLLPMSGSWRTSRVGYAISKGLIGDYLTQPDDALAQLEYPEREVEALD